MLKAAKTVAAKRAAKTSRSKRCPCGDNDGLWCSLPGCPNPKQPPIFLPSDPPHQTQTKSSPEVDVEGHPDLRETENQNNRVEKNTPHAGSIASYRSTSNPRAGEPSPQSKMVATDEMATTYKAAFRTVFDRWLNDEGGIPQENIGLIATKAGLQAVFDALTTEGQNNG